MRSLALAMLWFACTPEPGRTPTAETGSAAAVSTAKPAAPSAGRDGSEPTGDRVEATTKAGNATAMIQRVGYSVVPPRGEPAPRTTIAAHDAEIVALAATEDERVAISADRHSAIQLWPSL